MRGAVELSDVHDVVLVLQDRSFVVVDVEVIRRREDGHDTRETCCPSLAIHSVSSILRLVSSNDGKEIVLLQEIACSRV